ncbi:hydroxypyruvate isomerase family protein [Natronohydrobacter thiooxidans]|uniref:hydroxypyruvate isomerase family protein n=1 Tax=Natronohydrobacter thiooxidans TaxID=87172 RepID=UPI0008FF2940|nr:TIM barrel protein [Natronohydrobacter thiooxidans]
MTRIVTKAGAARFSANLGFLWTDLPLPARIRAAASAGFDAVEFHDDAQTTDPALLRDTLSETALPVCSLNTRMGASAGCAALPGQEDQARRDIDAALGVARAIGAAAVHVLAGRSDGDNASRSAYLRALRHALDAGEQTILIEPLSRAAMPGYYLQDLAQALGILQEIAHPRLKLLFDCYHIAMEGHDVAAQFAQHAARIGHVQIASVPGRNEPGTGDRLDYARLLPQMRRAGYAGAFGCEYRPVTRVEAGLGWRATLQEALHD